MLVALVVIAICVAILFLCRGQNQVSSTALRALDGAFRLAADPAGAGTARRAERVERNVTPYLKKIVAASGGWRCACCRLPLDASYEVDHIIPLPQGGTNDKINLQALRSECHKLKTSYERARG